MSWIRVMWPESLRTRLILLVLLTLAAAQGATLYSITVYQRRHARAVSINLIATTIRTLHHSIDNMPPEERADFVRQASGGQWRLWSRALPDDARMQRRPNWRESPNPGAAPGPRPEPGLRGGRPRDGANDRPAPAGALPNADHAPANAGEDPPDDVRRRLGAVVGQLNAQLGRDARVALSRGPTPEIFISFAPSMYQGKPGPREWLVIPIDRLDPPISTGLVAWWSAGLLLVITVAVWFSWHITRPITLLVQATDQLAAGNPQRVSPAGPTETRMLGERFNAMIETLAEAESTRRTLLAGLPHDLKGPLSRMWLRIEMADDKTLKEGMRSDLQDMQHMVDQFIGYLRGTDVATYRFEPIALDEWVNERVASWTGANTGVQLLGKPAPVLVNGDSVALARLLDNLVSNALHHGAPPVHISLNVQDHWAVMRISDHGQGIPIEQRADAVRPFVRLDAARTRSGNVGLGLAVADVIARAHGGSLSLGQGSEGGLQVEVRLPIYYPSAGAQGDPPA